MADSNTAVTSSLDPREVRLAELETQLRQREALIEQLQRQLAELTQCVADLERAAKRQATPFARQRRKEKRQRPGRKAGQGPFKSRPRPTPDQVAETKEQPLEACPECGGPVTAVKEHEQFVVWTFPPSSRG